MRVHILATLLLGLSAIPVNAGPITPGETSGIEAIGGAMGYATSPWLNQALREPRNEPHRLEPPVVRQVGQSLAPAERQARLRRRHRHFMPQGGAAAVRSTSRRACRHGASRRHCESSEWKLADACVRESQSQGRNRQLLARARRRLCVAGLARDHSSTESLGRNCLRRGEIVPIGLVRCLLCASRGRPDYDMSYCDTEHSKPGNGMGVGPLRTDTPCDGPNLEVKVEPHAMVGRKRLPTI